MKWPKIQLDTITEEERPITYGVVKPGDEGSVTFIRGGDIVQGKIAEGELRTISEQLSKTYKRTLLRGGELLISLVGNPGEVAIAPPSLHGANIARQVGMIALRSEVNSRYVMYYLMSPPGRAELLSRTGGAVQQVINLADLKTVCISLPKPEIQDRIANTLSAYDDLIENNRRRMALLEESARLLYQEWFVCLRFPGHEHTRIVNGLPEGWTRGVVSDFYKTASGGTPSRVVPAYFEGEIPWAKTQELPNGFIIDTAEKITEDALKHSSAKIFPDRTVLIALYGATVGETGILSMPAATNQACCAVMPNDLRANYIHAFLFFRENKSALISLSAGAAQNNISQQIIRDFEMQMPPKQIADSFFNHLSPVFDQWLNMTRQTQKLRDARDLLLPRLMSGELAI